MLADMRPHEREARAKGIPALGSGVIYPVQESLWVCDAFEIPDHWPRAYGMDVGWNRTAAVWGAWDRDSDTVYEYSEHYIAEAEPQIHADAIRSRGDWIVGAIDPASQGRSQKDGTQLAVEYSDLGLNLVLADNTVEAGIHAVHRRLASGRLKTFRSLVNTIRERRIYRRDEKGKVVKENDHAMDAERYLIMTGLVHAAAPPWDAENDEREERQRAANPITGY